VSAPQAGVAQTPPLREEGPLRLVVVGAGIAGLAAASRAVEQAREAGVALELTVFETAPRAGGHIVTEVTAEGFLVEGGRTALSARSRGGCG